MKRDDNPLKSDSRLERILRSGAFAITAELGPPKSAEASVVCNKAALLRGYADAINITDNQTAIVRLSSIAGGTILVSLGLEPVIQMTCRDRNRIAMQSDLLGAWALGMRNVLCLTGDHQKFGNHPGAKNVFDLDSIQLIQMVKDMRDEAKFQCGETMSVPPRFFIGAAENPFADPFEFRALRLAKKVAAGADFIQTQLVYNVKKFARWMAMVRDLGLHERVFILAGVGPIKSVGVARYMKNNVPGLDVPDEIVERMASVPKGEAKAEGIKICVEIIDQVRQIEGVAGVHIMAIEWEEAVAQIATEAGLLPRPVIEEGVLVASGKDEA
ncbi:MAG: methylenetetrahydrofolate reductase [Chloroflexi bacterium]|nr:methylenetetrahydrofolate reductase [Chloroflexota bacterium]